MNGNRQIERPILNLKHNHRDNDHEPIEQPRSGTGGVTGKTTPEPQAAESRPGRRPDARKPAGAEPEADGGSPGRKEASLTAARAALNRVQANDFT